MTLENEVPLQITIMKKGNINMETSTEERKRRKRAYVADESGAGNSYIRKRTWTYF